MRVLPDRLVRLRPLAVVHAEVPFGMPRQCFDVLVTGDELIRVVRDPTGREYAVVIAPPGSALDDDGEFIGGRLLMPMGFVLRILSAVRSALSSKWRIVVQERMAGGSLGPVTHRGVAGSKADADAAASELVRQIRSGSALG